MKFSFTNLITLWLSQLAASCVLLAFGFTTFTASLIAALFVCYFCPPVIYKEKPNGSKDASKD